MKLPQSLLSSIREGSVVLYLGSRVFDDAKHPQGKSYPNSAQLVALLSRQFLNGRYDSSKIETVLEFCEHGHGSHALQHFLHEVFSPFRPSSLHYSLAKIPWRAVITTEISTVLEEAFASDPDSPVKLATFYRDGQRVDDELLSRRHIPYLKLRGTIGTIDQEISPAPFVEQRPLNVTGRQRLFERACELALEHPVLFIGNSYEDLDIYSAIGDFCAGRHPRAYAVLQSIGDLEAEVLQKRRVDTIRSSASEFLKNLQQQLEPTFFVLASSSTTKKHSIDRHLRISADSSTPENIINLLESSCTYIHSEMSCEAVSPRAFYRGMTYGWGAVLSDFDVRRRATGDLVISICLGRVAGKEDATELVLVKGHAGCGKSVFLKRVALECASNDSIICLYDDRLENLSFQTVAEIYRLSKKRIAIFFDNAAQRQDVIAEFIRRSNDLCIPVTLITTERHARWNTECTRLHSADWREFNLGNLNEAEVRTLLELLDKHNCLGVLKSHPLEERIRRLSEYAERQLLVALHEVTMGDSFEQIIINEYKSISSPDAQALYRTICICHRFGIPVRAGLVSRVHGIPFERFRTELFSPLEEIVFAPMDFYNYDHVYRSRHQDIAKIVFEQVISRHDTKTAEYQRLIMALDVDYSIDRNAMIALTKARDLLDVFDRRGDLESIFSIACGRVNEDMMPFLLQQMAIMEMRFSQGSLEKSEAHIQSAQRLAPRSSTISHTASEIARQRALAARGDAQKKYHKSEAIRIAGELLSRDPWDEYAAHTLLKVALDEMTAIIDSRDQEGLILCVAKLEEQMERTLQKFPDASVILESDARFRAALNQNDRALNSLRAAVRNSPDHVYYVRRLAQAEFSLGNVERAIKTLEDGIKKRTSGAESLHEELAQILQKTHPEQHYEILQNLRRSFTLGGTRISSHYNYAVYEFLHGDKQRANEVFSVLRSTDVPWPLKKKVRAVCRDADLDGVVVSADFSFAHVKFSGVQIIAPCSETSDEEWSKIRRGSKVRFTLAFQYMGPLAVKLVVQ